MKPIVLKGIVGFFIARNKAVSSGAVFGQKAHNF